MKALECAVGERKGTNYNMKTLRRRRGKMGETEKHMGTEVYRKNDQKYMPLGMPHRYIYTETTSGEKNLQPAACRLQHSLYLGKRKLKTENWKDKNFVAVYGL